MTMNAAQKLDPAVDDMTAHDVARAEPLSDAEAISCLLDGELDAATRERVLKRLMSDADAQGQWSVLHLVGDALRSSEVGALHQTSFAAKCSARLANEPAIVATRWARERRYLVRRVLLPGTAVAAAVAMLAVVAVPQLRGSGGDAEPVVAGAGAVATPVVTISATPVASPSRPMAPYLQAHREIAPSGVLPARAPYLRTSATVPAEGGQ